MAAAILAGSVVSLDCSVGGTPEALVVQSIYTVMRKGIPVLI